MPKKRPFDDNLEEITQFDIQIFFKRTLLKCLIITEQQTDQIGKKENQRQKDLFWNGF